MTSSALRTFAVALVALAVLFGVLAYLMSRPAPEPQTTADHPVTAEPSGILAVVAVRPLDPYRAITADDVTLVPIAVEPAQYYTDTQAVVGRTPVRRVATGLPVTEEAFGRRSALAEAIPPGTQAMSLEVTDVVSVGGFVQPGDFVDVLLYLRASGTDIEHSQARVLMRDARVLAYQDQLIGGDGAEREPATAGARRERTVVLAVPDTQTTRVMLASSLGELRLALRPADDRRAAADINRNDGTTTVDTAQQTDVITLAELARLNKHMQTPTRPTHAPSAQATIEVYEGANATRVQRPYP